MINSIKKIVFVLMLLISTGLVAQENDGKGVSSMTSSVTPDNSSSQVQMADALYQSGKIYVVVIVVSIIFAGITGYLIMLDRKISKLEKEINKK